MDDHEDLKEHGTILGIGAIYVWVGIGIVVMATTLIMYIKPVWLGMEREAFVESHQYVESHKDKLMASIEEYDELEMEIAKYEQADGDNEKIIEGMRQMQWSLSTRIRNSLSKIPKEHHPSNTERFNR